MNIQVATPDELVVAVWVTGPLGRLTVNVTLAPVTGPMELFTVPRMVTVSRGFTIPGVAETVTVIGKGGEVTVTLAVPVAE